MKIAIIGYGPAAIGALDAMERHVSLHREERPDVTVICAEKEDPYAPMFLIKYLTGELTLGQLSIRPKAGGYAFPFHALLGCRAVGILDREKKVVLEDGREIGFDKLLIANGATPILPPVKGLDMEGVFFLSRLHEAEKISRALPATREVVIVGAGAMGMEAAIALRRLGKGVTVVERLDQILPQTLSPHLAGYVQGRLEAQGMEFRLGAGVSEMTGKKRRTGVVTRSGEEIEGDMILLTAGVRPNTDLVKSSAIGTHHGIMVNDRMQTSIPDIYAAGDAAESRNAQGGYELVFNWYSAISQGWIAGCNMMGQTKDFLFCPMLSALKEIGFPVISIGRRSTEGGELLSRKEEKRGIFEEISVRNGFVESYQAIGVKEKVGLMYSMIKNRKKVDRLKKDLLTESFNATRLIS